MASPLRDAWSRCIAGFQDEPLKGKSILRPATKHQRFSISAIACMATHGFLYATAATMA